MSKKIRILFTGGGTGGHIYPLIAVAVEAQALAAGKGIDLEIRYLGAYGPYRGLLERNGMRVGGIIGSKLRRYFSLANLIEAPKMLIGMIQALVKVGLFRPQAVFSKGGPGALPVVWASKFYRIPILVHESDAVPGMTSLWTGRYAQEVAVSFESAAKYFPGKTLLTGNPIRKYLLAEEPEIKTQEGFKKFFGFDPQLPLLLFLGGSQGAVRLNNFVLQNLQALLPKYQILHQTGVANYDRVVREFSGFAETAEGAPLKNRYQPVPYFNDDIRLAMRAADVVVSRSGAGSIFEIAAFGKPSVLIPLPEAAQNHQLANAREYAASGAALVLEEKDLNIEGFAAAADSGLANEQKKAAMSEAALKFSKPDAAKQIAAEIYKLAGTPVS